MYQFLIHSNNIQNSVITESEAFSGEMLKLSSEDILMTSEMLDWIVKYYNATYEMHNFQKSFEEETDDSIIICVSINKFGRYQIGSKIFNSEMSYWHNTNSYILVKFITNADKVDCYSSQIQYFFKHTINLPEENFKHNLAYVQ